MPVEGVREDIQYYDECDSEEDEEAVAEVANAMRVSAPTNVQPAPVSELDLICKCFHQNSIQWKRHRTI